MAVRGKTYWTASEKQSFGVKRYRSSVSKLYLSESRGIAFLA